MILKNLLKKSVIFMGISGFVLTVLALVLSEPMAAIFVGYNKELFDLTNRAFMFFAPSFLFAGFNIFVSGFFTALNNGAISAAVAFLRTLLFQSASILLLPKLIGEDGIWLSIIVAEIFAFVISLLFLIAKRKRYHYI